MTQITIIDYRVNPTHLAPFIFNNIIVLLKNENAPSLQ
jgi:hypothetical protein